MPLIIKVSAVWGYLGQILVYDSYTDQSGSPFRYPPKWWEWRYAPDGWIIGRWRWVKFDMPGGLTDNPAVIRQDPTKGPPSPALFKGLLDKNGPAVVNGGAKYCMALYARNVGDVKSFDGDWELYTLLSAEPGNWAGLIWNNPAVEPDINTPWPRWSMGMIDMTTLHFNSWGYFKENAIKQKKETVDRDDTRAPRGTWKIMWDADQFDGDPPKLDDPYMNYIFDSSDKGGAKPSASPPPFMGRRRGI